MINNIITRSVDELCRVVIPKNIIESLKITPGADLVDFKIVGESILFTKHIKSSGVRDGHYYDIHGNEIHAGDRIYDQVSGEYFRVYTSFGNVLGIDITNPKLVKSGKVKCGNFISPLTDKDLEYIELCKE